MKNTLFIKLNPFLLLVATLTAFGCSKNDEGTPALNPPPKEEIPSQKGEIPRTIAPDVDIALNAIKISQLVGEMDRQKGEPTQNQTFSRYGMEATDLGVPFKKGDTTYVLFGDTWGTRGGLPNVMAYTTDNDPDDGLALNIVEDNYGSYNPITVPGISQNEFEVPTEGVVVNDKMYIYHTTDHSAQVTMGRSVVARSNGDGGRSFEYLYDFSTQKFINISVVQASSSDWDMLPGNGEDGLMIFGSGTYRESHIYLAYQPAGDIEDPSTIMYFAGVDKEGGPRWENSEAQALPIFDMSTPCVGEFSVSYNKFIDRWILLYNCGDPRGINMRTAESPSGPWSDPQVIFEPWEDNGYCNFMHTSWIDRNCDSVHDTGRENEWGGEYGPYQFEHFAKGDDRSTTIYFTMSTWNPYTVVLMKSELALK